MPKLKPGTLFPAPEEDAKIREVAASDPDTMLLEDGELKVFPLKDIIKARRGRQNVSVAKPRITIRHSDDIVEAFRASGPGWQTRMDIALRDWLLHHNPSDIKL